MIWYLLYPFRGTTDAPVLTPNHPIRSLFTRYGIYAARHAVATLLISVAVAATLIYPIPFLYTDDFTTGASNLPHHVWTDAQPLEDKPGVEPDIIMRSLWVHGSYMNALGRDVLLGGLELQDGLLGSTRNFSPRQPAITPRLLDQTADLRPQERDMFHIINGLTEQSWFFHSPLQYWSCDHGTIAADVDIISTVNAKRKQPTSVNVTLRHSAVFSGKRFKDRALVAADALVITLLHRRDSPVGRQWERNAEALASRMADKWTVYPRDGKPRSSQPYEFYCRPISVQDSVMLSTAYSLVFIYLVSSLSKLRAVKSKPGLIITVMVQICASTMSSFAICALLKIDLSKIPGATYPIVVFSRSLENMLRLINAVILIQPEETTSSRVGRAFGQTTHIALGTLTENLLLLWSLSKAATPAISAFCTFAAIAFCFDFFYFSTFFLSVLSVEVRRTELSDALEKASPKHGRSTSQGAQSRQSWSEAVLQGKIAMSTRVAGTVVMLGFVMIAQWHFFENESVFWTLSRLLNVAWKGGQNNTIAEPSALLEVHQARSPGSWLRLQDHEAACEVIHVIKPSAHSYVARVYDPLVFVLKGSDRMPSVDERVLLPAVYDFARHQSKPWLVTVVVLVAAVSILMNYLLWDEIAEAKEEGNDAEEEPLVTVKTMGRAHTLDVAMMSATSDGEIVSVGLDRVIRVWDVRSAVRSHFLKAPENPVDDPFPVLAMAVDEESSWLAILSSYRVFLWNLRERRWSASMALDTYGQRPEAFFFGPSRKGSGAPLVLVRRDGTMAELRPDIGESVDYDICKSPLASAVPYAAGHAASTSASGSLSILATSRRGCVHHVTTNGDRWLSHEAVPSMDGSETEDAHAAVAFPLFSSYLVVRSRSIDLMSVDDSRVIFTFQTERIQPRSVKCLHSGQRQTQIGTMGLGSLTLAYVSAESGDCVVQTYLPQQDGGTICFCDTSVPASKFCCPLSEARMVKRHIARPGVWEVLPNGSVVGVRRIRTRRNHGDDAPLSQGSLRRRGAKTASVAIMEADCWEVWCMSQLDKQGDYEAKPLNDGDGGTAQHLIISELGPMVRVGSSSVAVGFGNLIKIITVGHERFGRASGVLEANMMNWSTRRRKVSGLSRKAHSRG